MIDFVGIGAQKCASSWFYEHLRRHPDIVFPTGKETHYWDRQPAPDGAGWLSMFPDQPTGTLQGEITPAYAILPSEKISAIRGVAPNLRVFICLRNPMARAWSHALMHAQRAGFEFHEVDDGWFIEQFRSLPSRRRGDYIACIDNWRGAFGDRLTVVWFDDIIEAPRTALSALIGHIGADPTRLPSISEAELREPVFAGPHLALRPSLLDELRSLYVAQIEELERRFGRDLQAWRNWTGQIDAPSAAS